MSYAFNTDGSIPRWRLTHPHPQETWNEWSQSRHSLDLFQVDLILHTVVLTADNTHSATQKQYSCINSVGFFFISIVVSIFSKCYTLFPSPLMSLLCFQIFLVVLFKQQKKVCGKCYFFLFLLDIGFNIVPQQLCAFVSFQAWVIKICGLW